MTPDEYAECCDGAGVVITCTSAGDEDYESCPGCELCGRGQRAVQEAPEWTI